MSSGRFRSARRVHHELHDVFTVLLLSTAEVSTLARSSSPLLPAHALLPIPSKRDSDWSYAWIPVLGPLTGGLLAALLSDLI